MITQQVPSQVLPFESEHNLVSAAYHAEQLLELNPESIKDISLDFSSSIISTTSWYGRLISVLKAGLKVLEPCGSASVSEQESVDQVLQKCALGVHAMMDTFVHGIVRGQNSHFMEQFEYRLNLLSQWRIVLEEGNLKKLKSLFAKFSIQLEIPSEKDQHSLSMLKTVNDLESALREPIPRLLFQQIAQGVSLDGVQKNELKEWFELLNREVCFLSPKSLCQALEGALLLQQAQGIDLLSTLVWRLAAFEYVDLNRLDRSSDRYLYQFIPGFTVQRENSHTIDRAIESKAFGEYGIEVYKTIDPSRLLLASNNPCKLLTWHGAMLKCYLIAPRLVVEDHDPNYRWIAIEGYDCLLEEYPWKPSSIRIDLRDESLLGSLAASIKECVQKKISHMPPLYSFCVINKSIRSLVAIKIDPKAFSLAFIAQWIYQAVGKDLVRFRHVLVVSGMKEHPQFRFFSAITERVLLEKDSKSLRLLSDAYQIESEDVVEQGRSYWLSLQQLKRTILRTHPEHRWKELSVKINDFFHDRGCIFFIDQAWATFFNAL